MRSKFFVLIVLSLLFFNSCSQYSRKRGFGSVPPIQGMHAHNDYEHPKALLFALENGFTSIEADIHLVNGELLVAHDRQEVTPERSLASLYLQPLWERFDPHSDQESLLLLVDIKSDADSTFHVLQETVSPFEKMLRKWDNRSHDDQGPVQIIASGNRSLELIRQSRPRFVAYDGRLTDLGTLTDATLVPLISDKWTDIFSWDGKGEMPAEELLKLQRIVNEVHSHGQMIRFWGTPDSAGMARTNLWHILKENGVDWINTDDLAGLRQFMSQP